jgi:sugar phosphate permease
MEFHESKDNGLDISTSWEECKDASFVESKMTDPVMALNEQERLVEKKLLHKIDFLIMPLVILVYILNFLDRSNFAAAKLQGLPEDLNLTSNDYQIALSILYVGYVSFQVAQILAVRQTKLRS